MADLFSLQQNNQQPYFNSLYLTTPLFKKPQGIDNVFGNTQTQNVPEIKNESVFSTAPKSETPQTQTEDSKIDGLATEIKGYYVLTEDAAKKRLATQLSEAKTPEAQQKEFERLVATGMSKRDASILAGTLGALDKGVQVSAANKMLDNKNLAADVKLHSDNEVARNVHNLDVKNQTPVFTLVMNKTGKETQIIAAANIWKFDKSNQSGAMQVTIDTKNEAAIDAASAQWAKYDDSAKSDIKTMIQNAQYESAKTALATAEKEAQAKAEAEAKTTKESSDKTETTNTTATKIEEIKAQAKNPNNSALKESIKNLSTSEQISLLKQCPNDSNIIKILLQNNPSMDVLAEIEATLKNNGDAVDYKTLLPQLCFLSSNMQSSVLTKSAANNDLGLISKTTLNSNVRLEYDKLVNRQEKTGQLGLG